MESYMGRHVLDNCFDQFKIDEKTTSVFLSFPERWLSILEQRVLFNRLAAFYPNLKKVEIKTHSVYIVQCTHSDDCYIVDSVENKDDTIQNAKNEFFKYYNDTMPGNIFEEGKITVL
jgi:hypothetical protein